MLPTAPLPPAGARSSSGAAPGRLSQIASVDDGGIEVGRCRRPGWRADSHDTAPDLLPCPLNNPNPALQPSVVRDIPQIDLGPSSRAALSNMRTSTSQERSAKPPLGGSCLCSRRDVLLESALLLPLSPRVRRRRLSDSFSADERADVAHAG
ncbi:hypothetical protein L226DRAFT_45219 [Lentinus tigrinus ALCF2SS1-7]|nr:hypothetical protein L226DRAFT_45219 [Lentinus tigrinus ALCF2SS1-7]